jgi:hypothetical protein
MLTSAQLQLLRNTAPGSALPGIDTPTGNPVPIATLASYTTLTGGTYRYVPSRNEIVVQTPGTVISGINFGNTSLMIAANDVTVTDCTFTNTTDSEAIYQWAQATGATIENCTFTGSLTQPGSGGAVVDSHNNINITNNSFINVPNDGIHIESGTVSGNYFSYGGSDKGSHADAIYVPMTNGPISITNNFVDWTNNPTAVAINNNAIRVTTERGNTNNVAVSGNYLVGGSYTVDAGNGGWGTFGNISVTNNYIGFGRYGAFYPGPQKAVTESLTQKPTSLRGVGSRVGSLRG